VAEAKGGERQTSVMSAPNLKALQRGRRRRWFGKKTCDTIDRC